MKVAVTVASLAIVTVHWSPTTESQPVQAAKAELASGVAVSVTVVPRLYASLQSPGQPMPLGEEAMVPPPVPSAAAVSRAVPGRPVPVRPMSRLGVRASLAMRTIPPRVPVAVGENETTNEHVWPCVSVVQVFSVIG